MLEVPGRVLCRSLSVRFDTITVPVAELKAAGRVAPDPEGAPLDQLPEHCPDEVIIGLRRPAPFPFRVLRPAAMAKYLRRLGHDVTILTTSAYGELESDRVRGVVRTADAQRWRARLRGANGEETFDQHIKKLYYDTCLYNIESLELLFKVIGTDRCLFGTERPGAGSADNPRSGEWYDNTKPLIDGIDFLSPEDRNAIYEGNAKSLYGKRYH